MCNKPHPWQIPSYLPVVEMVAYEMPLTRRFRGAHKPSAHKDMALECRHSIRSAHATGYITTSGSADAEAEA